MCVQPCVQGVSAWCTRGLICVCLRKYVTRIQHALKINRRVNKQAKERRLSTCCCISRRRACGVSPRLSCLQWEQNLLTLNYLRTKHARRVQFGEAKEESSSLRGARESRICRSFKTSLSNSTPANGDCMWRNLKANRHSARMCKPSLTLLEDISHIEYKGIWLLSALTGLQCVTEKAIVIAKPWYYKRYFKNCFLKWFYYAIIWAAGWRSG